MVETGMVSIDSDELKRLRDIEKSARDFHDFLHKVIVDDETSPVKIVCVDDLYADAVFTRLQNLCENLQKPEITGWAV